MRRRAAAGQPCAAAPRNHFQISTQSRLSRLYVAIFFLREHRAHSSKKMPGTERFVPLSHKDVGQIPEAHARAGLQTRSQDTCHLKLTAKIMQASQRVRAKKIKRLEMCFSFRVIKQVCVCVGNLLTGVLSLVFLSAVARQRS
ncbi:hypothetical protein NDU88_001246 [Pleurodeles waltl]|uniref:Uncharacterized protein n=1 Tax=Pleurodeles waltl TaxID=8319 RepID=A0AAV7NA76_PLEWA|nr:hypothetical protein NDU88_001246 [Pleurodeles waltl]